MHVKTKRRVGIDSIVTAQHLLRVDSPLQANVRKHASAFDKEVLVETVAMSRFRPSSELRHPLA